MAARKDANKALDRLRGSKLLGNTLKAAWAPGKGVKESGNFKEYWDVDLGVTYLPKEKLPGDLTALAEGGMIDDETLPDQLKSEYYLNLFCKPQFKLTHTFLSS